MPTGCVEQGVIKHPTTFAETIHYLRKNATGKIIQSNYVVAALPEDKIYMQIVSVPIESKDKILEYIYWQADKLVSFSLDNTYLDYHIVTREDKTLKVLITACPKEVIDPLIESFRLAQIVPVALDSRSGSLARIYATKLHELDMIVDIEQNEARIIVAKNHIARLSSTIQFDQNYKVLNAKIKEAIQFYISHKETNKAIGKIILVGDYYQGFPQDLANTIGIQVEETKFSDLIKHNKGVPELNRFIVNVGLYTDAQLGVNLLPDSVKKSLYDKAQSNQLSTALNVMLGTMVICIYLGTIFLLIINSNTNKHQSTLLNLKNTPIETSLKDTQTKVNLLNSKINQMKKISDQPKSYPLLLAATSSLPEKGTITEAILSDKNKTLTLYGSMENRDKLLSYRDILEKIDGIASVDVPLKNYEQAENIKYEIILNIQ